VLRRDSLTELLEGPGRGRMGSHLDVNNSA
jgi:hypothetical protein